MAIERPIRTKTGQKYICRIVALFLILLTLTWEKTLLCHYAGVTVCWRLLVLLCSTSSSIDLSSDCLSLHCSCVKLCVFCYPVCTLPLSSLPSFLTYAGSAGQGTTLMCKCSFSQCFF